MDFHWLVQIFVDQAVAENNILAQLKVIVWGTAPLLLGSGLKAQAKYLGLHGSESLDSQPGQSMGVVKPRVISSLIFVGLDYVTLSDFHA